MRHAPSALSAWGTLFLAFNSVKQMFVENRPFTEPRQHVIASSPALQERATAKTRLLIASLSTALSERGIPAQQANLAAQVGMTTLGHAVAVWLADSSIDLVQHIVIAFDEVRDLSSSSTELASGNRWIQKVRGSESRLQTSHSPDHGR